MKDSFINLGTWNQCEIAMFFIEANYGNGLCGATQGGLWLLAGILICEIDNDIK
jgi:hypothetical protein